MARARITKKVLDKTFFEQRELTDIVSGGTGLDAYLENLGFDPREMFDWAINYVQSNIGDADWSEDEILRAASFVSRALVLGVIIGRRHKP